MKVLKRPAFKRKLPTFIPAGKFHGCDTETTGLDAWHGDTPFAVSFASEDFIPGYIDFKVDPKTRKVLYPASALADLRWYFQSSNYRQCWFNGKFDRRMLSRGMGINFNGKHEEVWFAAHTCNTLEEQFGLKYLAERYLDIPEDDEKDLQKATVKARNFGKKNGWLLGPGVKSDYWMVKQAFPEMEDLCKTYAELDAVRTIGLWSLYYERMKEEGSLWETYRRELQLEPEVEAMENVGIAYYPERCSKERKNAVKERDSALTSLRERCRKRGWGTSKDKSPAPCKWNEIEPSNATHVRHLLYGHLKKPVKHVTAKTGIPAADQSALEPYKHEQDILDIFRVKSSEKAIGTFFDEYERLAIADPYNPGGRALHCNYRQTQARTGRFSCTDPNLQQVPSPETSRSVWPINGRVPFGPRPGYNWVLFDYSQLEVRIFADVSQEPTLLDDLLHDRDVHTTCANKAWGGEGNPAGIRAAMAALGMDTGSSDMEAGETLTALEEVHKSYGWQKRSRFAGPKDEGRYWAMCEGVAHDWLSKFEYDIVKAEKSIGKKNTRQKAKMVFFALIFGGGPAAITGLMYVTWDQAEEFLGDYKRAMPGIVQYIKRRTNEARRLGYIFDKYGRKIRIPSDKAYKAVNYTVQGSAATLMKNAMLNLAAFFRREGVDARMLLTIHDEIVFEIREAHTTRKLLRQIKAIMEDHGQTFGLKLPVDGSIARHSWADKTELKWLAS